MSFTYKGKEYMNRRALHTDYGLTCNYVKFARSVGHYKYNHRVSEADAIEAAMGMVTKNPMKREAVKEDFLTPHMHKWARILSSKPFGNIKELA